MNIRCLLDRTLRAARAGSAWSAGFAVVALLVAFSAPALAVPGPVLNGNIDDVVAQANLYISNGTGCGIIINDPQKDVCLSDPLIVPCTTNITTCINTGQYYVNGFDQTLAVAAVQGTDAWWGIRVVGQIGDSDGDGTDSKGSNCPPPGLGQNPEDQPGIAEGERYIFRLDTNCDGTTDIRITVQTMPGDAQGHPTVIITDGGGINPIPGASGQAQYGTTDLEIHTTGLVLPALFSMSTFVGSDFDGLSEDAAGPKLCNIVTSLTIQKTADKPSICPGDKDRFTITVNNTSGTAAQVTNVRDVLPAGWTYANNISGDFAFNSQNGQVVSFGPLTIPAGATRTVSFDATSPSDCLGPYENKAVADGSFSSPCLPAGSQTVVTDTARVTVTCQSKPCVNNAHCTAPPTACNGDQIGLKFFATNCGDRPADVIFTFGGHQHIVNNVAAGAEAEFDTTIGFVCSPTAPTVYSFSAVSQNSCGTSTPATNTCSTACGSPPCATVTCSAPASANNGDQVQLSAIGHNCGDRPADLLLCIYQGSSLVGCHWARNVGANTDARFDTTVTFQCQPGTDVTYSTTVQAVNSCGTSQAASSPTTCPIHCNQVGGSCPRTVGFWGQQCAQKGNGSTKFSVAQVTAIASCIDSRVQIFDFGSDKFGGFCAVINPSRPMDCRKQALRQFAGLLANACVGQLGYKASNGDSIFLNLTDPNPCKGAFPNAQTLGDLIDAIDALLVQLKNGNVDPQGSAWCTASECADGINNGQGIPIAPGCGETVSDPSRPVGGSSELQTDASGLGVAGSGSQVLELYRPTPNPFSNTTSFAYQVAGSASQRVQIGIYNVAGRLIRELVNDTKAPGQYTTVWNGQDQGGASVTHGVYFIRAYVGGVRVSEASRILYLR